MFRSLRKTLNGCLNPGHLWQGITHAQINSNRMFV